MIKTFDDYYRGKCWYISGKWWLIAFRWRLYFYNICPPLRPGYRRFYFGPFELELR